VLQTKTCHGSNRWIVLIRQCWRKKSVSSGRQESPVRSFLRMLTEKHAVDG